MQAPFVLVVCVSLFQGLHSAQWSSTSPQDGVVKYVCSGGSVTLPWKYILSSGGTLGDIEWIFDGSSQEMVAISTHGQFLPLPAFASRVQAVDNAGITVSHLTVAESGNYSVEINVYGQSGNHIVLRRSAIVQVSDQMMTQDGHLHVIQSPEAVLDTRTNRWAVQLQCGVFPPFHNDPPFIVEWITPSGDVVNSSDFKDNHFNLLLTNPVHGGNYTCRVPSRHAADACLQGNGAADALASIYVDRIDARFSLLEKENEQLKAQLKNSDSDISQLQHQVQTLEQVKVADLQNRVNGLEDTTRLQVGFHAIFLHSRTPPSGTPLIVNHVLYNHGNAYSGSTGYFTVPYPGVYFFAGTTGPDSSDDEAFHYLYADDSLLSKVYTFSEGSSGKYVQGTVHAVAHLTRGQKVFIRSDGSSYWDDATSFSGFLISPDP